MSYKPDELRKMISDTLTEASVFTGLKLNTPKAIEWLITVCAHESHMGKYRKQINGPAIGIYQMEPYVIVDIQRNVLHLKRYQKLKEYIQAMTGTIQHNDAKSTMFARAQMLRFPEPFPSISDRQGQAELWKLRWNTDAGRGTIEKFLKDNEILNPV